MSERIREAAKSLAASDPAMAELAERFGTVDLVARFRRRLPGIAGDPFLALLRSIVGQQLSTASAEAIFGRLVALAGDRPTPAAISAASDADLRTVGLSRRKVEYVHDLAARVLRRAIGEVYGLEVIPIEVDARRRAERWRPHRSLAAMYLWESATPRLRPVADSGAG
jgi:3-methyladenine DNA glycosylase/8-oxoguanine DNA glycosylase